MRPKTPKKASELDWRECLECGNRYPAARRGYRAKWCSPACETAAMRHQRDQIETSWMRTRWFLR